jgi:hypothetical protein
VKQNWCVSLTELFQVSKTLVQLSTELGPFGKLILRARGIQLGLVGEDLLLESPLFRVRRSQEEWLVRSKGLREEHSWYWDVYSLCAGTSRPTYKFDQYWFANPWDDIGRKDDQQDKQS